VSEASAPDPSGGPTRGSAVTTTALPPPGWYEDPWRVTTWRWWDGRTWSGYTDQQYATAYPVAVTPSVRDDSRPIRAGWTALLGMVAGVVLSIVVYVALRLVGVPGGNPLLALASELGLWAGLLGACLVAVRRHGTGSLRDLGLRVRWVDLPLGVGYGLAMLVGVGIIANAITRVGIEPHRESLVEPMHRGTLTVVVVLFIAVVGAPFVEELFFRGLLMSGFVARFGTALGIIFQAIVFGLVHLGPTDARGNLGVFLLIAPVGAVLGVLRFGYKRLGTGMLTHAAYNAVIMTIALTR
jgi:membrane protease YdiL (CAAX protease family)